MNANVHDVWGNNGAVSCPECHRVYVVSGFLNHGARNCPECGRSQALFDGENTQVAVPTEPGDSLPKN